MPLFQPGYDTETVRQMLEHATAESKTMRDVWNLARPGKPLAHAQIRSGFFHAQRTREIIKSILRRRLAAQLGRVSPRLLDPSHDLTCQTCGGVAVTWEGRWLCENGCGGNTNA